MYIYIYIHHYLKYIFGIWLSFYTWILKSYAISTSDRSNKEVRICHYYTLSAESSRCGNRGWNTMRWMVQNIEWEQIWAFSRKATKGVLVSLCLDRQIEQAACCVRSFWIHHLVLLSWRAFHLKRFLKTCLVQECKFHREEEPEIFAL